MLFGSESFRPGGFCADMTRPEIGSKFERYDDITAPIWGETLLIYLNK